MKILNLIFLCIFSCIFFSKPICSQNISVNRDTIFMDVKGKVSPGNRFTLTHAFKIGETIYSIFKELSLYSQKNKTIHFVTINVKTNEIKWLDLPQEMKDAMYFDFYEKDHMIHLLDYHEKSCYVYNVVSNKWSRKSKCNDVVYKDKDYLIAYQDHGEWGEYTWFWDTKNKDEYIIGEDGKQINKIKEKYYLSTDGKIIEIESPTSLKKCGKTCYFTKGNKPVLDTAGIKLKSLYNDSISDLDVEFGAKRKLKIESSWVWNDHLIQLYSTDSITEIGFVRDSGVISLAQIATNINLREPKHSYRGNSNYNNYRFHHFSRDENNYGFIELKDSVIHIFELSHNQDSLIHFNKDLFKSYWDNIDIFNRMILYEDIKSFEAKSGGIQLNENRSGPLHGLHPKDKVTKSSQFESYVKIENAVINQVVQYHFDKVNGQIKSLFFELSETETYKTNNGFNHLFRPIESNKIQFKYKFDHLIDFISKKTNVAPVIEMSSNYYVNAVWKLEGNHEIRLYASKDKYNNLHIKIIIF